MNSTQQLSSKQKSIIIQTVKNLTSKLNDYYFPIALTIPTVDFYLTGFSKYVKYYWDTKRISVNEVIAQHNFKNYIDGIIPHIVSYHFSSTIYPLENAYGGYWKEAMSFLGVSNPVKFSYEPTYNLNVNKRGNRQRHNFKCHCGKGSISHYLFKKITLELQNYSCKVCKDRIKLIKS